MVQRLWAACTGVAIIGVLAGAAGAAGLPKVTLLSHSGRYQQSQTVLVTPQGRPVGGKWQRWMNEARIPTYQGIEVLSLNARRTLHVCVTASGCSAPAAPCYYATCGSGHPETWLMPDDTRDSLYYEHGHIIDFTMATDTDRAKFMRIWRLPGTVADWWNGEDRFSTSHTLPPGERWSAAYQLCADGVSDRDSISAAQGVWSAPRWAPAAQRASCRLFRHL